MLRTTPAWINKLPAAPLTCSRSLCSATWNSLQTPCGREHVCSRWCCVGGQSRGTSATLGNMKAVARFDSFILSRPKRRSSWVTGRSRSSSTGLWRRTPEVRGWTEDTKKLSVSQLVYRMYYMVGFVVLCLLAVFRKLSVPTSLGFLHGLDGWSVVNTSARCFHVLLFNIKQVSK